MLWLLHNSQNTGVFSYSHPQSLSSRLHIFARAIPSELNTLSFPPSPQAPQVSIPQNTWPSVKVHPPWSLSPNPSAESNLSLIKPYKHLCTSLRALLFLHGRYYIYLCTYMYKYIIFIYVWSVWIPKGRCSSKISAGPSSYLVYTTFTHYPFTTTISPLLHHLLPLWTWFQHLYSDLQSYGSLKFRSLISIC